MSKDDGIPDIPSWEELGISPEELKELEEELAREERGEPPEDAAPTRTGTPARIEEPGPAAPPARSPGKTPSSSAPPAGTPPPGSAPPSRDAAAGAGRPSSGAAAPPDAGAKRRFGFFRRRKKDRASPGSTGRGSTPGGSKTSAPPAAAAPVPPARPPLPPATRWRGPLTVVLLLLVAWLSSSWRGIPRPVPADAPDSLFSAERAWVHLERIARAPHPPGSPEHARVREHLLATLAGYGLDPQVQTTTQVIGRGSVARAVTVRNVLARIPGSEPGRGAVLITAHYDGREVALAAGDDGAGVVTLLEAIRALRTGPQLRHDVIVLLTDAEELGLVGARAFVDQHSWMDDVRLVLSFEMRGGGGPSLMFETGAQNGWVVQQFAEVAPYPHANSLSVEIYRRLPNDTDFTPFREAGRQGLNFAAIGRAHVYHQAYDTPANLSRATVQNHGVQALALLRHFGDADLDAVTAPDRAYFSIPYVGVFTYPGWVSWVLSVVLVLGWILLIVRGRAAGLRVGGMVVGLLVGVGLVAGSAGAGVLLLRTVTGLHPEAGRLHGSLLHAEWPYVLALVAAAFTSATVALLLTRRWFRLGALALGALTLPLLAAAVMGFLVPLGAANLQGPALGGLLAAAVALGVEPTQRPGHVRWVLWLLLAVPVLVFLVPLTELLWLSLSLGQAALVGGLAALIVVLLLPLVDVAREPNGWGASVLGLIVTAVFVGIGLALARPGETRPLPSTLVYALDREDGSAVWALDPAVLEADAADRADLAWARERAGTPDTVRTVAALAAGMSFAVAPAPRVAAAPPRLSVATDSASALAGAPLRVRVASAFGAEALRFTFPDGGARPVAINGRPLGARPELQIVEHWGEPEGGAVVLDLDPANAGDTVRFDLVETTFRPSELVGPDVFRRPAGLAPDIRRLSDRAVVRTPVAIDVRSGTVALGIAGLAEPAPAGATSGPGDTLPTGAPADSTDLAAVELFAPGVVSSAAPEFAITFTPDGRTAFFNRGTEDRSAYRMLASLRSDTTWGSAEAVPFASAGMDVDPFVSPDGNRIWFSSDRPRAGAPAGSISSWYVERTATGWSDPIDPGAPFNSDSADIFVSEARDGTVVFRSERDGRRRVYATRRGTEGWETPVALRFGTVEEASNPMLHPSGTWIVLSLPGPGGEPDLYASCRTAEGMWGEPFALPAAINSPFAEFAPAFHPDGTLYFTSERPGVVGTQPDGTRPPGDIYRVRPGAHVACDGTAVPLG
ncbi:MAG: M28 family peptidase [Gemmatimonadota bacterium]